MPGCARRSTAWRPGPSSSAARYATVTTRTTGSTNQETKTRGNGRPHAVAGSMSYGCAVLCRSGCRTSRRRTRPQRARPRRGRRPQARRGPLGTGQPRRLPRPADLVRGRLERPPASPRRLHSGPGRGECGTHRPCRHGGWSPSARSRRSIRRSGSRRRSAGPHAGTGPPAPPRPPSPARSSSGRATTTRAERTVPSCYITRLFSPWVMRPSTELRLSARCSRSVSLAGLSGRDGAAPGRLGRSSPPSSAG